MPGMPEEETSSHLPTNSLTGRFNHNAPKYQRIPHPDPKKEQELRRMALAIGVPRHLVEPLIGDQPSFVSAKVDYEDLERRILKGDR